MSEKKMASTQKMANEHKGNGEMSKKQLARKQTENDKV